MVLNPAMNRTVLMSGVEYFSDAAPINPFMDSSVAIDLAEAADEHRAIQLALEQAGVTVTRVAPPANCQDGVFTANWALVRGNQAVLARLPNARKDEEACAKQVLEQLGKTVHLLPDDIEKYSGQGDSLACGHYLLSGSRYRSDEAAHVYAAQLLGYQVVQLQTKPQLDEAGAPVINRVSGWPDSFYYDIDLALSVLKNPIYHDDALVTPGLVGYCPAALTTQSIERLRALDDITLIEVSEDEAVHKLACNLVSTGSQVVMNDAPDYAAAIENHGLEVIRLQNPELAKGGGSVRCTTLTID